MKNPYKELLYKTPPQVEFEIATGSFECQKLECMEIVHEAKYIEEVNVLTWKCPEGHISKVENFE